jgi:hypothetical protein
MCFSEAKVAKRLSYSMQEQTFKRWEWSKDDIGFYIAPMVAFSWGKPYGKNIWIGWFRWLFSIHFR